MGIREIRTLEITCDYPPHGASNIVQPGYEYHRLVTDGSTEVVICHNCWDNKMSVESLLVVLDIEHQAVMHVRSESTR